MLGRSNVLAVVFLVLSTSLFFSSVSAQNPIPSITVDCEPKDVTIDVSPGASRAGTMECTAENPSLFTEEISIDSEVSDNAISMTSPSSLTVPPSGSVDFTVTFIANSGLPPTVFSWNLTALVTTVNGVPISDLIAPSDSDEGDVIIAEYARMTITTSTMTRYVGASETANSTVEISNDGNAAAKMGCIYSAQPVESESVTYELLFDSNSHYEEVEAGGQYSLMFNFTSPSPSETLTFEINIECKIYDDDEVQSEKFNVEVEAVESGGLSSLGNSIGIDDSTMIMVASVSAGVLVLLVIMLVGIKLKAKKLRANDIDEDLDYDVFEEDDDEFDFDDL